MDEKVKDDVVHQHIITSLTQLEKSLHEVYDRQSDQLVRLTSIEKAYSNVIRKIEELCEGLKKFKVCTDGKFKELDEFKWFRVWITQLRDNLFKNVLKLIFILGSVYALIKFGENIVSVIVK